jgi:glycosyltransferase involved in cell wall biosynthesis
MNVALVHDYLRTYGDAEWVLQVLHQIYPTAPVYTAFVDYKQLGKDARRFAGWDIRTTPAQRIPSISQNYQIYRAWLPYFWESLDLSSYNLVISSSGDYLSKSVLTCSDTLHICYCHTPPRYLWDYTKPSPWYRRWYDTRIRSHLRQHDVCAAQRVDRFVTNSEMTARRIRKFYRRAVEVIPPPVQIQGEGKAGNEYYLYVGQLTRRQQVDLAIQACNHLSRPLWIVGTGSELERLKHIAGKTIRFLESVPESAMPEIYAGARALIYPCTQEDFGFPPVEAMGSGVPVIASNLSGMREIILDFRTGLLFPESNMESLSQAILKFEGLRFSAQACIQRAEEFAEPVFISKLKWFIAKALDEHQQFGPIATH